MPGLDLSYEELTDWFDEQEAAQFYGLSEWLGGGGGRNPITFPATTLRIRVELQLGPFGIWTDVTPYVLWRNKIRITRGRLNERSTAPASTARLTFKNGDRRFSPRNVNGPWYGQFGRNTKMRIWVNPGSGDSLRFTGEIPDWSPKWVTGQARTVTVEASGPLRRLEQGDSQAKSAMRRSFDNDPNIADLVAYWPLEGGRDTSVAYDVISGAASSVGGFTGLVDDNAGTPLFGVADLGPGSDAVAGISGGWNLDLNLPSNVVATGEITLQFAMAFGTTVRSGTYAKAGIRHNPTTATFHLAWNVFVNDSGLIELQVFEADRGLGLTAGPTTIYSAGSENIFDGQPRQFQLDLAASGGTNVAWSLYENDVLLSSGTHTPSFAGAMNAPPYRSACLSIAGADQTAALGHVGIFTANITPNRYEALTGHVGELPTDRFGRICTEEGISYEVDELVVDQVTMGPQTLAPFLTLQRECEDANIGVIDETFDGALRLISRTKRYRQEPDLIADYGNDDIFDIDPTDDDFPLRNDWTIDRPNGSFFQAILDDGSPLSISDPPTGVGRYDDSKQVNVETDDQLADQGYLRVRAGTTDELRYKSIIVAFHRSPHLIEPWLKCDIGSRVQVLNPPEDIGPDTVDQSIEGYAETFDQFTWEVDANTSPYAAGNASVYDDERARYDCRGSTLAEDLDTTETGVDLTITDDCVWGHDNGDYLIRVGGEDMTVTAVGAVGGSYPSQTQTLTVTRSVNGAVLTHASGTQVHVKQPGRYS